MCNIKFKHCCEKNNADLNTLLKKVDGATYKDMLNWLINVYYDIRNQK